MATRKSLLGTTITVWMKCAGGITQIASKPSQEVNGAFRRYGLWLALALAFHAAVLLAYRFRSCWKRRRPEADSSPMEIAVVESAPETPSEPALRTTAPSPFRRRRQPEPTHRPPAVAHQPPKLPRIPLRPSSLARRRLRNPGPATAFAVPPDRRSTWRIRSNPSPTIRRGQTGASRGVVVVSVEISGEGLPENITLAKSSGFPLLDQAAITGVRRWRFLSALWLVSPSSTKTCGAIPDRGIAWRRGLLVSCVLSSYRSMDRTNGSWDR